MRLITRTTASVVLILMFASALVAEDWPAWRGSGGMGISAEKGLPTEWDREKNVTWKVALPGPGNSTPIVVGERIFITQAQEKGAVRSVICFDRADGKERWKQSIAFEGKEPTHDGNPYCSSSPVCDGEVVVAWHGSAGLFAYDMSGKELWRRDLGKFDQIWGNASSPVIHGDQVILSAGPGLRHLLVSVHRKTGELQWSHEQTDAQSKEVGQFKGSWSTPVIHRIGDKDQIILSLPRKLCGLDPATGKLIWWCEGLSDLAYASPIVGNGVIVAMSGYQGPAIGMKMPTATDIGDLTATHRLWRHEKTTQRVGSGVIVGEHVYIMNENGIVNCIDTKTGEQLWGRGERVGTGATWSAMVYADDKLWVCNMKGETVVLAAKPKLEVIAVNPLRDMIRASLAISDGQLFIRTYGHLYCIGSRKK